MEHKVDRFGCRGLALPGMIVGAAIAMGVPYVVLTNGPQLSGTVHTIIIILSLLFGSTIALTAAFFGTVIPREVSKSTEREGEASAQGTTSAE